MKARSVDHTDFTIERRFRAPLDRVWSAWSDPAKKQAWFACNAAMEKREYSLDFRPGGHEVSRVGLPGDPDHTYRAHYFDIVPKQRFIYAYDMHVGDIRLSASLVTILFEPAADGTLMRFIEQIAFLDGHQRREERVEGTGWSFDMLAQYLTANSG